MVNEDQSKEIIEALTSDVDIIHNASEEDLKNEINQNLTHEQNIRDKATTELYRQFVKSHKERQEFTKRSKTVILRFCLVWVSAFTIACIILSCVVIFSTDNDVNNAILLISALVPMIAAIIGTLNIVTNHVFPKDEDKNITEIVKLIHENDLKNKQENLKQQQQRGEYPPSPAPVDK